MSKAKKKNFVESEVEVLLNEVTTRRNILFGSLSSARNTKIKKSEWERGLA